MKSTLHWELSGPQVTFRWGVTCYGHAGGIELETNTCYGQSKQLGTRTQDIQFECNEAYHIAGNIQFS